MSRPVVPSVIGSVQSKDIQAQARRAGSRQTDQAHGPAPVGLVAVREESGSGALAGRGSVHVSVGYNRPEVSPGEEHARGSHRTAPR